MTVFLFSIKDHLGLSVGAITTILLGIFAYTAYKEREYEHRTCRGYSTRANPKTGEKDLFRNNVDVRIDKKTNTYEYHDSNGRWYLLRKIHKGQIASTGEFDFPKRRKQRHRKWYL